MDSVKFGMNQYCGPAVLSILTGKNTDECAAVIGTITNSKVIKGVTLSDLTLAAKKLRFELKEVIVYSNTLFGAISQLSGQGNGIYLVMVPHHYVVVEIKDKQVYFCDNHTKEPIPAGSAARLGQKILAVRRAYPMPAKELVEREIKVVNHDYTDQIALSIYLRERYADPEDNKDKTLGYITVKNRTELIEVINKILATV